MVTLSRQYSNEKKKKKGEGSVMRYFIVGSFLSVFLSFFLFVICSLRFKICSSLPKYVYKWIYLESNVDKIYIPYEVYNFNLKVYYFRYDK
jgi:hypothetical protein